MGVFLGNAAIDPGAPVTAVYFGATKIWPAAAGIQIIGSEATAQNANFGQGVTSITLVAALPAGCQVGDVAVLSCGGQNVQSFAWVAPSGATTALGSTAYQSTGLCAIFIYTLTQADVDAGSVGVPCTALAGSAIGTSIVADVRRGVSQNELDVIGTLASGTAFSGTTTNCTAPGITTDFDGDLLSYSLFMDQPNDGTVVPPDGWTAAGSTSATTEPRTFSGFMQQPTSGPTGNVTVQTVQPPGGTHYAIVLLALRRAVPAIELEYDLPDATIGTAYPGGTISAWAVDGASTALTLDTANINLPDGLSTGTPTGSGTESDPKVWTVGGTPASDATTETVHISVSNGSQTTTKDVVLTVSAGGATAPPFIGAKYYGSGASGSAAIPTGCQAGDFVLLVTNAGSNNTFTLANSSVIVPPTAYYSNQSQPVVGIYRYTLTAADVTNGSIPVTFGARFAFGVWRASAIDAQSAGLTLFGSNPIIKPMTGTVPGITTQTPDTALVLLAVAHTSAASSGAWTDPTGFTDAVNSGTDEPNAILVAYRTQAAAGATGDVSGTEYDDNAFGSMAAFLVALKS